MGFFDRLFGKKTQPAAKEWPADVMALTANQNDATGSKDGTADTYDIGNWGSKTSTVAVDDDDIDVDDDDERFEDITGTEEDVSDFLSAWGYPGYDFQTDKKSPVGRIFFIDGEDLADYGVEFQINEVEAYLKGQGLPSLKVEETDSDARYVLNVNGREIVIYDAPGPSSDSGASKDPAIWLQSTIQLIRILNWLLETAGSTERAYATKPGTTDAVLVFLTSDLFQRLSNEPLLAVDERPVDYGSLDNPTSGQNTSGWSIT